MTTPSQDTGTLDLFGHRPVREPTLEERCEEWIAANPHIWDKAVQMLRVYRMAGTVASIRDLFGWLRVEMVRTKKDSEGYALNNSFTAPLARRIIARHPELADTIRTRGEG